MQCESVTDFHINICIFMISSSLSLKEKNGENYFLNGKLNNPDRKLFIYQS